MAIKNLESIQEAYDLVEKGKTAKKKIATYSQDKIDKIVLSMAEAAFSASERLASLAVGETGMGRLESKIAKNCFAAKETYNYIKSIKTVGIIKEDKLNHLYEIAEPVGLIIGVIPVTNPTSTTIFKALIAIKSRNSIIFSPHPKAAKCIYETAKILNDAAIKAGAPENCITCLTKSSIEATQELMKHPDTDFVLATGGPGLVKAAYQSSKPAIGVGAGNTPSFIERTADIQYAVKCLVESQTFDFGTICSSEQSVLIDSIIKEDVIKEFIKQNAYLLKKDEVEKISRIAIKGEGMNPSIVGQPAYLIAEMAGLKVQKNTTILLAPLDGVGPDFPLSREKLSPILALYVEKDWTSACKRCMELLSFGGLGHTVSIHTKNPDIVMEFALKKSAFRIIVNAPTSQGSVGFATNLVPSMTLGCGTLGGNITSDNITATHLFNKKRVAMIKEDFEVLKNKKNPKELYDIEISENNVIDDVSFKTKRLYDTFPVPDYKFKKNTGNFEFSWNNNSFVPLENKKSLSFPPLKEKIKKGWPFE